MLLPLARVLQVSGGERGTGGIEERLSCLMAGQTGGRCLRAIYSA